MSNIYPKEYTFRMRDDVVVIDEPFQMSAAYNRESLIWAIQNVKSEKDQYTTEYYYLIQLNMFQEALAYLDANIK